MPPKKDSGKSSKNAPVNKKRKTEAIPKFGAPSEADAASAQDTTALPSSSAACTRSIPQTTIPPLTTLCGRAFVLNFLKLRADSEKWERCDAQMRILPDFMIPKLSSMLQASWPTYLSDAFVTTYLLRGPEINLSYELPGVRKHTILSIERLASGVRELTLTGFKDIEDRIFASVIKHLTELQKLVLRGCTKVGAQTIESVAQHCPQIRVVNLNFTSVTPIALVPLATSRRELETLKLAGIQNWTDVTFSKFIAAMDEDFQLPHLHTLKLRQTDLTESSLAYMVERCPALTRLDISFTNLRHLPTSLNADQGRVLEKLSLTSTQLPASDLVELVQHLPELRVLSVGAMGGSTLNMTDDILVLLTDALSTKQNLEKVSLVANQKLGRLGPSEESALDYFVRKVGRKCKVLNLAGLQHLRSTHLSGFSVFDLGGPPRVETLILDNTGIDDEAGVYIGACHSLKTLTVTGTRLTREGIFPIIDNCPDLASIDVTSCRGIRVTERRRIFELWEEERERQ